MSRKDAPLFHPDTSVLVTFETCLGWMALVGRGQTLEALVFGHPSPQKAIAALDRRLLATAEPGRWNPELVRRLEAFAAGAADDLLDVPIDPGPVSPFRRRVIHHCRRIAYGRTITYGQLAAKAGHPRAARAVGSCMAANRIALVVPCHRVVAAGGRIGAYSAPGGGQMKRRLLAIEAGRSVP